MLTLTIILGLAALIMGIAAAAQKGGPLMAPVAIVLLAIALLLQKIPVS